MTIHIEALTFSAIIGILDFERLTPQAIIVDATIDYTYSNHTFINYADVIKIIQTLIIEKKYGLLEDALTQMRDELLRIYPEIAKFKLKITKPEIISNAKVALSLKWKKRKH